ncbi:MAG: glycosyltransferase family 39 protein [Candidatus Omnitrophica bacterium]|jgi:4-amino-4-deoxy-L-arabinose transferase-like glycosyltransferase|nr:glycosyltransferase family 39 protein [Candidatus Omnitrophota bacterium]
MQKKEAIILGFFLAFILLSGIYYAITNSVTSDEKTHIATGYINVKFSDYRFNIEHPPFVKQLAALPLIFLNLNFPTDIFKVSNTGMDIVKIQDAFLYKVGNDLDLMLFLSRLPNILISLILAIFIYLYSRKLNGKSAGFLSLLFFAFSPTFLAHTPLVTMDTAVSCFYFITIYFFMRFAETKKYLFVALTGLFLGLSLISKFSALILIPVMYFLSVILYFNIEMPKDYATVKNKIWKIIFFMPFLILVMSYKKSVTIIAPLLFVYLLSSVLSKKLKIAMKVNWASAILLVVLVIAFSIVIADYTNYEWFPFHSATKAYFKGFDYFTGHAADGQDSYLLGKFSHTGWWYYFPLAIFFKEPFVAILFIILGFIGFCIKKEKLWAKLILFIPMFAYLFVACFINKVNIGVRHILPIYPFLYVIVGYSIFVFKRFRFAPAIFYVLISVLIIDVVSAYPGHLAYFNRIVGGSANGYKLLDDSNIAWGQDWKRFKKYSKANNINKVKVASRFGYYADDVKRISYEALTPEDKIIPSEGWYVIETTQLRSKDIQWLDKIKPVTKIGGSLLVYRINKAKKP